MRNDIAFIEAAYAVMRLGAYAVPVNWHFKPDEVNYVLKDSGTSVLIGHADLLHGLSGTIESVFRPKSRINSSGDPVTRAKLV
jgi:long-chain acyl-CoA synthetase